LATTYTVADSLAIIFSGDVTKGASGVSCGIRSYHSALGNQRLFFIL